MKSRKSLLPAVLLTACLIPLSCLASFGSFDEAYAAGKSGFESQDFSAAQEAFNAALELAPDAPQRAKAREGLADCLLEFQDYDGCRALAEQTLEDVPGKPGWAQARALRQIAESYRREKRFDEMAGTIERASNWTPNLFGWLNLGLGAMWYRERMWEECDKVHRDLLASETMGHHGWALYWLARTAQEAGRKQEALGYIEQFGQLGSDDVEVAGLMQKLKEKLDSPGN
ncbi:MAG: tetratricopeptide repeat protein [Chthoniobacterales bacterium]|jgi:tetratricopeptide (TPR) repeat protein